MVSGARPATARRGAALATVAVMAVGLAIASPPMRATAWAAGAMGEGRAVQALRTLHVHDQGYLRYHSVAATSIFDQGSLSGTLPGAGHVQFIYDGSPHVTARFTIYASGGAIYGQSSCTLHDPTSLTPSFHGALTITGGNGRYAHASGSGNLYGVFHRRGYALEVQAIGELRY